MGNYLSDLNPQQRKAVEYGISPGQAKNVGLLPLIAGRWFRQTKTLTYRAAHLLVSGLHQHQKSQTTFWIEVRSLVSQILQAALPCRKYLKPRSA